MRRDWDKLRRQDRARKPEFRIEKRPKRTRGSLLGVPPPNQPDAVRMLFVGRDWAEWRRFEKTKWGCWYSSLGLSWMKGMTPKQASKALRKSKMQWTWK